MYFRRALRSSGVFNSLLHIVYQSFEILCFHIEHIQNRRHGGEPLDNLLRLQLIAARAVFHKTNQIVPPIAFALKAFFVRLLVYVSRDVSRRLSGC
jgi:hypothetical protein